MVLRRKLRVGIRGYVGEWKAPYLIPCQCSYCNSPLSPCVACTWFDPCILTLVRQDLKVFSIFISTINWMKIKFWDFFNHPFYIFYSFLLRFEIHLSNAAFLFRHLLLREFLLGIYFGLYLSFRYINGIWFFYHDFTIVSLAVQKFFVLWNFSCHLLILIFVKIKSFLRNYCYNFIM